MLRYHHDVTGNIVMFVSSSTKRVVRFVPILTTRILLYIAAATGSQYPGNPGEPGYWPQSLPGDIMDLGLSLPAAAAFAAYMLASSWAFVMFFL